MERNACLSTGLSMLLNFLPISSKCLTVLAAAAVTLWPPVRRDQCGHPDVLAAIVMAPIIAKEGVEGLQGKVCDDCACE
jgi:hypothetical protein